VKKIKQKMFNDFKKRYFFEAGPKEKKVWPGKKRYPVSIFSVEELATIFHPPSGATATPSFERIESKKGSAPSNLPI
jgi:ABC-type Fe3+-hydroxamate transport system substrate-binding protein